MSRLLTCIIGAVLVAAALSPSHPLSAIVIPPAAAQATQATQDLSTPSNLPVPRFATIGSNRVHLRQGPSQDHRILWVYEGQQGLPVEVVAETEIWRQIRDPDGDLGWVHRSLISESRGVVVTGEMRALRRRPAVDAPIIAYLQPRVVARLNECGPDWCEITVDGFTGWLRHDDVWGVYPQEIVE